MILDSCEPRSVFYFFEKLSEIPRGSGNEKAVSDYITGWARGKGLRTVQDKFMNVVIFKPGTPGYENHPALIIQGHTDMVCEKNKATVHDFLKDPIKLLVEGDLISADGTTLGADNGIAVAIGMALLDADDIVHPPLEIIFTSDEEAGMSGAEGLDVSGLTAKRMINMDTDIEGTFVTGCAGGVRVDFGLPVRWESSAEGSVCKKITVTGLKGGHSGIEIDQGRACSNKILGRVLNALEEAGVSFDIASVSGGMKMNAIPREAEAVVTVDKADLQKFDDTVFAVTKRLLHEYRVTDPGLTVEVAAADEVKKVICKQARGKLISSLMLLPFGVLAMSADIPGLVETSCNVGVMETTESKIEIKCMPRSSVQSRMWSVKEQISALARIVGASVNFSHEYPAWEYGPASPLRKTIGELYKETTGKDAVLNAVHAGLECGILGAKMPGLDIISFGPNAYDLHTPDESLSLSSTERIWKFLIELLKKL